MKKNNKGFTLVELLVVLSIFIVVTLLYTLLLTNERARTRDARRMADMVRLETSFELLFNEKNSYAEAAVGCGEEGSPASNCSLTEYWPAIAQLEDPGSFEYLVTIVPEEKNYEVSFRLERDYDRLAAGRHTVSPEGIK
jgi:prepilin-type N-terminal cleavage/methylation domain-containing protein